VLVLALLLMLAPPEMHRGVVVSSSGGWIEIDVGEPFTVFFTVARGVTCPNMRPGSRVRFASDPKQVISRIEVVTPAPIAMEAAVEEFVAGVPEAKPWKTLTPDELDLIAALGSPCYYARETATKTIRSRAALRPLIWARRSGDPEVRLRAGVILEELGR
jgi:hypothetical protein